MSYLVIYRHDDEPYIEDLSEEELLEKLHDEWDDYDFLDTAPDLSEFPSKSLLIFKGEIVIPKAKERITRYTLP